jgi:hypothetical protein
MDELPPGWRSSVQSVPEKITVQFCRCGNDAAMRRLCFDLSMYHRESQLHPFDLPSRIPTSLGEPSDEGTAPLLRRVSKISPDRGRASMRRAGHSVFGHDSTLETRGADSSAPHRSIPEIMTATKTRPSERHVVVFGVAQALRSKLKKVFFPAASKPSLSHQKTESSCTGGLMETLRNKSFWGAIVFVAVFVTSIVVLLADNAMAR